VLTTHYKNEKEDGVVPFMLSCSHVIDNSISIILLFSLDMTYVNQYIDVQ
jgi:hypothetical protein